MNRLAYAVHRWLGAIVAVQLVAWSLGGLVFSIVPLARVRGEHTRRRSEPAPVPLDRVKLGPAEAAARAGMAATAARIELRALADHPVYEIAAGDQTVLVDAETGARRSPIGEETARAIALADQAPGAQIASVHPVVSDPPSEYRGLPLPAWRVVMDDREGTSIYVDRAAGRVRARRNHAWRRHDFFWMLHTMDYRGRDDFNHPLLVVAAAMGMLSSLSGLLLWSLRIRRRIRRRKENT